MTNKLVNVFFHWLPLGAIVVLLTGFTYVAVQQNYREGLNDPQIQVVRDISNELLLGRAPKDIVPDNSIFDIEKSLSPFGVIYDVKGNPLTASATLGGVAPKPPVGVFDYAKLHGEDRVTWQPNANTRIALVIKYVDIRSGYFVASGRNMKEVESRISDFTKKTGAFLLLALLLSFLADFVGDWWRHKTMKVS